MNRGRPLPADIEERLTSLGNALESCPGVVFAETCADVANHVIADRKLEVPKTYAETFEVLDRAGLLEHELAKVMIRIAGFRNVLVHEYTNVDGQIVVRILQNHLADLAHFRDAARAWV